MMEIISMIIIRVLVEQVSLHGNSRTQSSPFPSPDLTPGLCKGRKSVIYAPTLISANINSIVVCN